jgi:HlyD family secretion protein
LANPPSDVRPDLSATSRIVTDTRKQALAIPIIALTVRENTPVPNEQQRGATASKAPTPPAATDTKKKEAEGVFVVSNGVATFRAVKVGIAGEEYFEVIDGVKEGDQIVAGPYQAIRDLKEGARVKSTRQASDSASRRPS